MQHWRSRISVVRKSFFSQWIHFCWFVNFWSEFFQWCYHRWWLLFILSWNIDFGLWLALSVKDLSSVIGFSVMRSLVSIHSLTLVSTSWLIFPWSPYISAFFADMSWDLWVLVYCWLWFVDWSFPAWCLVLWFMVCYPLSLFCLSSSCHVFSIISGIIPTCSHKFWRIPAFVRTS